MMNSDDEAIVKEIGAAVRALNVALERANGANLAVNIDYVTMENFGKRETYRAYRAEVSRQAFKVTA